MDAAAVTAAVMVLVVGHLHPEGTEQIWWEIQADLGLELGSWRQRGLFCEWLGLVAGIVATLLPSWGDLV